MIKKWLTYALIAMLVFYAFTNPQTAGHQVGQLAGFLIDMANGFGTFVSSIGP
jgi:branched-subunit amino acid transport protein AzlD